ncbi:MAG: helix-turn-helix domain-containing protein [Opitutaceae bacterium]
MLSAILHGSSRIPLGRATGSELLRLGLAGRIEGAANLAKLLGIDVSLAYRLLRGERQLTATQIRKVADTYGMDPVALLPWAAREPEAVNRTWV